MGFLVSYFKNIDVLLNLELVGRILIALVCGALVGFERTNRGKGAGIRTHTIVAIASCLMMIISQYGFGDFFKNVNMQGVDLRHDPSRIAAQIVSGIGFLGAGMIFIQKNVITGLTTAAGIWAVSGIGMAIGCGMYFIGITCTAVIILAQFMLHKNIKHPNSYPECSVTFVIDDTKEALDSLVTKFKDLEITINEISYEKKDGQLEVTTLIQLDKQTGNIDLLQKFHEEGVKSVHF